MSSSKLSVDGFEKAAKDALATMQMENRRAEKVLALAVQVNTLSKPKYCPDGSHKGKKVVLARVATIAYYSYEDGKAKLIFNCGDALNRINTEEQWITLDEFNRIQKRMALIIGIFPLAVRLYLCDSQNASEIASARNWLLRLFGALAKLPNEGWASKAQKEHDRLVKLIEWEERTNAVLIKPQPATVLCDGVSI